MCDQLALQVPELRTRVEPNLLRQSAACPLEGGKRFGLAARAVEREHQLAEEPLSLRVVTDQRLELADELRPAPDREIGIDPVLERDQPPLLQSLRLSLRERLIEEVRECRPTPEGERGPQRLSRLLGPVRSEAPPPIPQKSLEPVDVELVALDMEHVSGRAPRQPPVAERLAQARHVGVERVSRCRRRTLSPQAVDQAIARDDVVGMQQQDREHGPLLRPAERQLVSVAPDDDGAENRKLHRT